MGMWHGGVRTWLDVRGSCGYRRRVLRKIISAKRGIAEDELSSLGVP